METVKLNVTRKKSFVGGAMPYRILLNGKELAKIMIGKTVSFDIPKEPATLEIAMYGNALTFHKIKKSVQIAPENCRTGVINCTITTKAKTLGVLSCGLLSAVGKLEIDLEYC